MITVENLCKTFRVTKRAPGMKAAIKALANRQYTYVEALKNVSFQIEPGEIVGYIGPNGAGKSTTIKVMSGILVPDSGSCRILGRTPWQDRINHVKNIGVVFGQRSQLMWDIPVIDSFELIRDIYRVPKGVYQVQLQKLTEAFDLGGFINMPVRQLSLGQRMRCEITASLLHCPPLLFLDEPTIGLDAVSKVAVRRIIKEINQETGVTVILTTHDMGDIEALTDRILLIGNGKILYDGSFQRLREKYSANSLLTLLYDPEQRLAPLEHVEIKSDEGGRAVLSVDTSRIPLSRILHLLSNTLTIYDITVQAQPVEEIIIQLYQEFSL